MDEIVDRLALPTFYKTNCQRVRGKYQYSNYGDDVSKQGFVDLQATIVCDHLQHFLDFFPPSAPDVTSLVMALEALIHQHAYV